MNGSSNLYFWRCFRCWHSPFPGLHEPSWNKETHANNQRRALCSMVSNWHHLCWSLAWAWGQGTGRKNEYLHGSSCVGTLWWCWLGRRQRQKRKWRELFNTIENLSAYSCWKWLGNVITTGVWEGNMDVNARTVQRKIWTNLETDLEIWAAEESRTQKQQCLCSGEVDENEA